MSDIVLTPQQVFVYGTLKQGFGNHRLLANSKFIGRCTVPGVMLHMGRIPAMVHVYKDNTLSEKDTLCRVAGEVYEVSWDTLQRLDQLEGVPHLYNRQQIKTELGTCWVYIWTDYKGLNPETLCVKMGWFRGGDGDRSSYRQLREFFARNEVSQREAMQDFKVPPHLIRTDTPNSTPQPPPPPPPVTKEPVVGPGVEEL